MDEYVSENKLRPDFIKIDTERSEFDVLQGMHQTLEEYQPIISWKVGDVEIEGVPSCKDIIEFMSMKDYQAYEYRGQEFIKYSTEDRYDYENIVFTIRR